MSAAEDRKCGEAIGLPVTRLEMPREGLTIEQGVFMNGKMSEAKVRAVGIKTPAQPKRR